MGEEYVSRLRGLYKGRVPGGADLVTYWFEKARAQIETGRTKLAGLVATNSIRGGANRKVLQRIRESGEIFNAWSDEPWINEGAAVRASLIAFSATSRGRPIGLNGTIVSGIFADLSGPKGHLVSDLTLAMRLRQNQRCSFMGTTKVGPFDVDGTTAREWLQAVGNPSRNSNSDVLRPWRNTLDITRRNRDRWIIDFGVIMGEGEIALYQAPFEYAQAQVKPFREQSR